MKKRSGKEHYYEHFRNIYSISWVLLISKAKIEISDVKELAMKSNGLFALG